MTTQGLEELVNNFIEKWLPESYAHLVDTDDNDGERLRQALRLELTKARLEEANRVKMLVARPVLDIDERIKTLITQLKEEG